MLFFGKFFVRVIVFYVKEELEKFLIMNNFFGVLFLFKNLIVFDVVYKMSVYKFFFEVFLIM